VLQFRRVQRDPADQPRVQPFYKPLSTATLQALYPTHGAYVSAFTSAAASDLAAGLLTPADYNAAVAAAQASPVP
jgi:hypothetical protein